MSTAKMPPVITPKIHSFKILFLLTALTRFSKFNGNVKTQQQYLFTPNPPGGRAIRKENAKM